MLHALVGLPLLIDRSKAVGFECRASRDVRVDCSQRCSFNLTYSIECSAPCVAR